MPNVILVDEQGNRIGSADVVTAHSGEGMLHKAFSVYVFRNGKREILMQKRSAKKRLWPLTWANTCCSHPHEEETSVAAGTRRLQEECGFVCDLQEAGSFVYRAKDPTERGIEHEHVTLLIGNVTSVSPMPNPDEVAELQWILTSDLQKDMEQHPSRFAPWFHLGLKKILSQEAKK